MQFANFEPKPDHNPNPNPNPEPNVEIADLNPNPNLTLILTLAKVLSAFCKLCRLTNCMQHADSMSTYVFDPNL